MSGWICSYRKIWDHPLFAGNAMRVGVWHWMMHKAVISDTRFMADGQVITLHRGQFCASHQQMCDATGMTRKQLRTFLDCLEAESAVVTKRANERAKGRTIITICNYDEYQNKMGDEGPSKGQARAKQGPTKEQGNNLTTEEGPKGPLSSADDFSLETPAIDDVAEAVSAYNTTASQAGWPLVRVLSKERRSALKARLHDAGGIDGWREALRRAQASPYCCGQNDRGWIANFDFLTQRKSFIRLMEGNYDARSSAGGMARRSHPAAGQQQAGILGAFARREAARGG